MRKPKAELGRFDHAGEAFEQTIHPDQGIFLLGRRRLTPAPLKRASAAEAGNTNKPRLGDIDRGAAGFEQAGTCLGDVTRDKTTV